MCIRDRDMPVVPEDVQAPKRAQGPHFAAALDHGQSRAYLDGISNIVPRVPDAVRPDPPPHRAPGDCVARLPRRHH
eukprot:9187019-Pyramimonas_sp.AAC.1